MAFFTFVQHGWCGGYVDNSSGPLQPAVTQNHHRVPVVGKFTRRTGMAEQSPALVTQTFRITGMTCAGCSSSLQRALLINPGVTSASVSITSGLARVTGPALNPQVIMELVRRQGFSAEPVQDTAARSQSEYQQESVERVWRHRALVGMGLWIPLEAFHWTTSALHWHPAWMPYAMLSGALIILLIAGPGFFRSALQAARRGTTNMDTLISLGAVTAFSYSTVVLFRQLNQPTYFAEAAGLLGIVSVGHWLEARASAHAGAAVRQLLQMQPETSELLRLDGSTITVPSVQITAGQRLLIRPGSRIAVDGVILEGQSDVDESIVTGESLPVSRTVGQVVPAGAMNTTGRLVIRTTVSGRETTVRRMAELVEMAQTSRAPIQKLADRISAIFVPSVLAIAACTALGWWLAGNASQGLISAVTVLIISCPCALGLATPMAVMVGTGAAGLHGILIRDAETLERIGRSGHVVFDKTGTLTQGHPELQKIDVEPGHSEAEVLQLAAGVESPSEHPLAGAIVRAAELRGLSIPPVEQFAATPGVGVTGVVNGHRVSVERHHQTSAMVTIDGRAAALLTLADAVRPDAALAIRRLKALPVHVSLLTGDRRSTALQIAEQLGIEAGNVTADATPETKMHRIRSLGDNVVMVGDGLNDAGALAASGLGVAMASGTQVAIEAARVVIPGDRVCAVPELFQIARQTLTTIRQNLFFAFAYNAAAIPVAALGLIGEHGPLWAAVAMGLSDLTVVGNALRLKRRLKHTLAASRRDQQL